MFVVTGNGDFDPAQAHDYGDTILKLALDHGRLIVRDYFTPHNQQMLSEKDALKGSLHAAPAYWNRHVYVFGDGDVLHELIVRGGKLQVAHNGSMGPVDPGATPTVSANGDRDGIVWTISTRNWEVFPEKLATLHAYDATDVSRELYNSEQNSDRDRAGISVRFTIPSVANGRVYIGTRSEVDVYGLLPTPR